jgi:hypothetical protein
MLGIRASGTKFGRGRGSGEAILHRPRAGSKTSLGSDSEAGLIPRDTICELVRIEPGAVLLMMQRSLST